MSTYATDTFAGDGVTVEFTLTFDFISRNDVSVTRVASDGSKTALSVITTGSPTGDQYAWVSDTKVQLGTAPASGETLLIVRDTPEDRQIVDWKDGSYIVAEDLNTSDKQWLYNIQELEDRTTAIEAGLPGSFVTQLVAGDNITLSPTDGTGVVTITGQAGGGGGPANTDGLPEGVINLYYTNARVEDYVTSAGYVKGPVVTKLVAGNNIVLSPSSGEGTVTITSISGAAMVYMGLIDATGPAPQAPRNGDLYVNTASSGTVDATWTGIAGEVLTGNERLVYASDTLTWGMIRDFGVPEAPADGSLYARKDQSWESFTVVGEAPIDGQVYGRRDAGWEALIIPDQWVLSVDNLVPSTPTHGIGVGGTAGAPNVELNPDGSATFAGSVGVAGVVSTGAVQGDSVVSTGAIQGDSVTATGAVEGASVVATVGGFSGTELQLSGGATVGFGTEVLPLGNVMPRDDWSSIPARV